MKNYNLRMLKIRLRLALIKQVKRERDMRKKKYYAILNGFYHKYYDLEKDINTMKAVEKEYREKVCPAICKFNFQLNRTQALWLCETLGYGSWEKMWPTPEDDAKSDEEICNHLLGDVHYCSDRMSWDRLTRINWQYQRLLQRIEQRTECSDI